MSSSVTEGNTNLLEAVASKLPCDLQSEVFLRVHKLRMIDVFESMIQAVKRQSEMLKKQYGEDLQTNYYMCALFPSVSSNYDEVIAVRYALLYHDSIVTDGDGSHQTCSSRVRGWTFEDDKLLHVYPDMSGWSSDPDQ